jgi:hypothetical protein
MTAKQRELDREPMSALSRIAADPVSRRKFIGVSGGGIGAAAMLSACGGDDEGPTTTQGSGAPVPPDDEMESQFGSGDVGILNFALTLEYLEADFYDQAIKSGLLSGVPLQAFKAYGANEKQHIKQIESTITEILLGEKVPRPKTEFPLEDADQVIKLAATLENVGASAYLGQAPRIEEPDVLQAGLAIHTVEARHASALNMLAGMPISPDGPFAKPRTMQEVLKEAKPFIKS